MTLKRRGKRVICFCMIILLLQLCACTNEQKPTDDTGEVSAGAVSAEAGNFEMPEAYTEVLDAYAKLLLGTGEITEMTGPVGINSAIDLLSVWVWPRKRLIAAVIFSRISTMMVCRSF